MSACPSSQDLATNQPSLSSRTVMTGNASKASPAVKVTYSSEVVPKSQLAAVQEDHLRDQLEDSLIEARDSQEDIARLESLYDVQMKANVELTRTAEIMTDREKLHTRKIAKLERTIARLHRDKTKYDTALPQCFGSLIQTTRKVYRQQLQSLSLPQSLAATGTPGFSQNCDALHEEFKKVMDGLEASRHLRNKIMLAVYAALEADPPQVPPTVEPTPRINGEGTTTDGNDI